MHVLCIVLDCVLLDSLYEDFDTSCMMLTGTLCCTSDSYFSGMAFFWYTVVIPVLSANIIIGHEVVRLPVAHCELNPIEMAWSQVKGHVKRNNKRYINIVMDIVIVWHLFRFTLTEVKELVYQGFEAVTSERWQSLIKHVQEEVEDHYWEQDGLHEELLERFLIHVSSDSSDSEDGDGGDGGINDSSTTSNSLLLSLLHLM